MSDDIADIAAFYDSSTEHERLDRHQLEHDMTWRYLEANLPPTGSILEIGAATGRYTLGLCERGCSVTAVDLSPVLLGVCRRRITEAGHGARASYHVADARSLGGSVGAGYDVVLLMGPLYHLVMLEDRTKALREAVARLKAGGVFVSTHIARLGVLGDLLRKVPDFVEVPGMARSMLERGRDTDDSPRVGFRGYYARAAEIASLHEAAGLRTLVLAALEPAISADDESYNCLTGERRRLWLDLLFEVSAEPTTVDASRHLIYVGEKLHRA